MRGEIKKVIEAADISRRMWNYLMNGAANASPDTARRLEKATGIGRGIWVFGSAKQRQSLWGKEVKRREKEERKARRIAA